MKPVDKAKLGKQALGAFFDEVKPENDNERQFLGIIFELLCNKKCNFLRFKNENLPIPPEKEQEGV